MQSNIEILTAQKAKRERRRINLHTVSKETGLARWTVYAMARDELKQYPKEAIEKLCAYFGCEVGELLQLEPAQDRAA